MTAGQEYQKPTHRWMIHDVIVGLLSGAGVGAIAGIFVVARVSDNNLITLAGAVIGAMVGVLLLLKSHQNRPEKFATPTVITAWVLLVLSALFIASLVFAIANFT